MTKLCYLVSRVPDGRPAYPVKVFLDEALAQKYANKQSALANGEYWRIDRIDIDLTE